LDVLYDRLVSTRGGPVLPPNCPPGTDFPKKAEPGPSPGPDVPAKAVRAVLT